MIEQEYNDLVFAIGMWATAELIEKVGCDNVPIDCDATDVSYVKGKYTDEGTHAVRAGRA